MATTMAIGATVIKEATMAATSTMRWYSERAIISHVDECNHESFCVRVMFDGCGSSNCCLDEGELDISVDVYLNKVNSIV